MNAADQLVRTAPIDWLLAGEAFVRYRTLLDLMGRDEHDAEVRTVGRLLCEDRLVQSILRKQNEEGYWGTPGDIRRWWPKRDTTFWVLGVLADFGLTRREETVARACEYVFSTQLPGGAFGWGPPPTPGDCFTGILAEALAKSGYVGDPRLQRAYDWMLGRQRLDGGFWCKRTGQVGGPRKKEPSCAFATLCVLSALVQHPRLEHSPVAVASASFLLGCWDKRDKLRYAGHDSQIGKGWEKLKYPFTDYRILKYLDVLTQVHSASRDARLTAMTDLLMSKRDDAGRFWPESIHKAWSDFDFGQKAVPSRWITLLAYRVVKRLVADPTRFEARDGWW